MTSGTDGQTAADRVSVEFLRECFDYRDGVLYWTDRPAHHFRRSQDHATFLKKSAGKRAGRVAGDGYIDIKLRINGVGVCFGVHRVVWAMHYGHWPELHLDHINRQRSDNRIENLREVTPAENSQNSSWKRVHPYVGPTRWGGFQAQVRIADTNIHVGVFDTEAEANAHRLLVNAALEGLARSLAKKSKTGRRLKDAALSCHQLPMPRKDEQ